jgi:hypothetical protein
LLNSTSLPAAPQHAICGWRFSLTTGDSCRVRKIGRRREAAQSELTAFAPPPKVVELHPAALQRYLAAIDHLAATLSRRLVEGDEEVAARCTN